MDRKEIVVKLEHPIEAFGEEVRELTLREPRVRELRKAMTGAKGEMDIACRLVSQLAAVPPSAIDSMHAGDFIRCSKAVAELMPPELLGASDEDEEG